MKRNWKLIDKLWLFLSFKSMFCFLLSYAILSRWGHFFIFICIWLRGAFSSNPSNSRRVWTWSKHGIIKDSVCSLLLFCHRPARMVLKCHVLLLMRWERVSVCRGKRSLGLTSPLIEEQIPSKHTHTHMHAHTHTMTFSFPIDSNFVSASGLQTGHFYHSPFFFLSLSFVVVPLCPWCPLKHPYCATSLLFQLLSCFYL